MAYFNFIYFISVDFDCFCSGLNIFILSSIISFLFDFSLFELLEDFQNSIFHLLVMKITSISLDAVVSALVYVANSRFG